VLQGTLDLETSTIAQACGLRALDIEAFALKHNLPSSVWLGAMFEGLAYLMGLRARRLSPYVSPAGDPDWCEQSISGGQKMGCPDQLQVIIQNGHLHGLHILKDKKTCKGAF
jgi:hypothetical protein